MQLWIQLQAQEEDVEFSDGASYEVLPSGVLRVTSGSDIHLYCPGYWQEVTIDTRSAIQRAEQAPVDADARWQ